MTQVITVKEASEEFGGFYVPRFEISATGSAVTGAVVRDVTQVTYTDSIDEIDSFEITVGNWNAETRDFKYVGSERNSVLGDNDEQKLFNPGAALFELKLGYGSNLITMMRGSTTSLEPKFPASGSPTLTVRALNALHELRSQQHRDRWPNRRLPRSRTKMSLVAQDIGTRRNKGGCQFPMPIRISQRALRQESVLDSITQDNQFDIDFLLVEAKKLGYVVYVMHETEDSGEVHEVLYFGPPNNQHEGVPDIQYTLNWGESLIDFSPKFSTAQMVSAVEIRSWNRESNQPIRPRVTTSTDDLRHHGININTDLLPLVQRQDAFGISLDRCRQREHIQVRSPKFTLAQAEREAAGLLTDRLKQLVEASGTTIGLPKLRAGQRVRIVGVGQRFSGIYAITKTTHTINDSGYITKFNAHREAPLPSTSGS